MILMKLKRLILSLVLLLLSSCNTNTSNSTFSESVKPTLKMSNFQIDVKEDFCYEISLSLSRKPETNNVLFLSKDNKLDDGDIEVEYELAIEEKNRIHFDVNLIFNDFYLIFSDGEEILCYENIVIPTFLLSIKSGTGNNLGNDILSFQYLENGYDASNFFDNEGINIFRSSVFDFSIDTEAVLENQSISDEFIFQQDINKPYYRIYSSFGSGKGVYHSQTFERDKKFGNDFLSINIISLTNDDGPVLHLEGKTERELSHLDILLMNLNDGSPSYFAATLQNSNFYIDVSLSIEQSIYQLYFSLNAGIFFSLDFSIISNKSTKKIYYNDCFYSFYDQNGRLAINIESRKEVNIISCLLSLSSSNLPTLSIEGYYDESLFPIDPLTGNRMSLYQPSLVLLSDDSLETELYPLTYESGYFKVDADLSVLTKLGIWYSIKLFFNTTMTIDSQGIETFVNAPTYELQISDADSFNQEVRLNSPMNVYRYEKYLTNLKLEIKDYSATVNSWEYILINDRMNLRLKGTFYRGDSHIDIFYGKDNDHHIVDVLMNENHEFCVDIDIQDILPYNNYHVHWIGDDFGDNEITNQYLVKPHAILSNRSGFIYSVKQESINSVKYYKVYKDIDSAKATDITFVNNLNKVYANIFGYVNSDLVLDDVKMQLAKVSFLDDGTMQYSDILYSDLNVNEDLSFTSKIDITDMKKNEYYQLKLIRKKENVVEEVTTSKTTYCAFYTEYLPSNYASKTLTNNRGTYRIRNFGGLYNHWEIYLILS